jgi:hypothetical protein
VLPIPPPAIQEREMAQINRPRIEREANEPASGESRVVKCVVWMDGVQWGDRFFRKDDRKGKKIMKQILENRIPSGLAPEAETVEVDIEFRTDARFEA